MKRFLILIVVLMFLVGCGSKEVINFDSMTVKEIVEYTAGNKFEIEDFSGNSNYYRMVLKTKILSDKTAKKEFLMDTKDILENLKDKEIEFVNIEWQVEFSDQYGNTEYKPILRLDYSKDTLNKINWDNVDYNKLDDIADDTWQHQALAD